MIIAMWSGPRNISTAMMRSWESRSDTAVVDEPFYAHYLQHTGIDHPGASDIIKSQPVDWKKIIKTITGPIPDQQAHYYQKHITTHMLPHIAIDWLSQVKNCFLIRAPEPVVASYSLRRSETAAADLGYYQQHEIYRYVKEQVEPDPLVIDSTEFLKNPEAQLRAICARLNIEFQTGMLSWEPGIRKTDGCWHLYWYDAVSTSTGFRPPPDPQENAQAKLPTLNLTEEQQAIVEQCREYYNELAQSALRC